MKRQLTLTLLLLLTASAMLVLTASAAGGYAVDWGRAGGGGAASTGGGFALGGTIGQAEAGPSLHGGPYGITGGLWAARR